MPTFIASYLSHAPCRFLVAQDQGVSGSYFITNISGLYSVTATEFITKPNHDKSFDNRNTSGQNLGGMAEPT